MLTTLEILKQARELLSKPGAWMTGNYAVDSDGVEAWGDDPRAVCWCSLGALQKVAGTHIGDPYQDARNRLRIAVGTDVVLFNDSQKSVDGVLCALDRAIADLEK